MVNIKFIKIKIQNLCNLLRAFSVHLQYYRYDPSRPFKAEFLRLDLAEQEAWIKAEEPHYNDRLYGEGYLGGSYQINPFTLDDHLQAPEDYGVGGMIASQIVGVSAERIDEIEEGATLSDDELEALSIAIAEQDYHGWDIHSGFYIKLRFGAVFALYEGEDLGQGGASFELECVFSSKRKTLAYIGSKPMAVLEVSNFRKRGY